MILVTGATGFIGRQLIEQLCQIENIENIVCLVYKKKDSELERKGREQIKKLGLCSIEIDLVSGEGLENIPKFPELVFHLASVTDTSMQNHSVNDLGTKNLFEAILPVCKETHFVFTSSIAVNDSRKDYAIPINETTDVPFRPCHEYGRKKLITEKYLVEQCRKARCSLSIVRVCGVYGDDVRVGGLFDSIKQLVKKKSILSRFNWPGKISIIHVIDMARFLIEVSKRKPVPGEHELYIPAVEALNLAEMSRIIHAACKQKYHEVKLPGILWDVCVFFAKRKRLIEILLPHRLYNRFWQACLLVNNEFWNESKKIDSILHRPPILFKNYYKK